MKEPMRLTKKDGSRTVLIDGLRTFITDVYMKDWEETVNNERYLKLHVDDLEKASKFLRTSGRRIDSKASFGIFGVVVLTVLARAGFAAHSKKISEIRDDVDNIKYGLKSDVLDLQDDVETLKAELYEMNERLHALSEKEDKKEE